MEELHKQLPQQPILIMLPELLRDARPRQIRQQLRLIIREVLDPPQQPRLCAVEGHYEHSEVDQSQVVIADEGQPADAQAVERVETTEAVGVVGAAVHEGPAGLETEVGEARVGVLQDLDFSLEDEFNPFQCLFGHPYYYLNLSTLPLSTFEIHKSHNTLLGGPHTAHLQTLRPRGHILELLTLILGTDNEICDSGDEAAD
jgi:hypothetical protein